MSLSPIAFAAPHIYYDLGSIQQVTLADFNNDGSLDLIRPAQVDLNDGRGSFELGDGFNPGFALDPWAVVAADFDQDGNLDMATANSGLLPSTQETISIAIGNGDGTFRSVTNYVFDAGTPFSLVSSDFNNDGALDLVTTTRTSIFMLLGKGDGTFHSVVNYLQTVPLAYVATSDFDHDGNRDLAIVNSTDSSVFVFRGNGDGSFQPPRAFATGSAPTDVEIGDVNGDSHSDIVTNSTNGTVLLGRGDGTFQRMVTSYALRGDFTLRDLNGDGHLDIASVSLSGIEVRLGRGDGTFLTSIEYRRPGNQGFSDLAVGDLTGDGCLDIVVVGSSPYAATLWCGRGDGTFVDRIIMDADFFLIKDVITGDLNGDGRVDIVTANYGDNDVSVSLGVANGQFAPPVRYPAGLGPSFANVVDINRDEILDIVVANEGSISRSGLFSSVSALLGRPDGTFNAAINTYVNASPTGMQVADLNADGKQDLLLTNYDNTVAAFLGNGEGSFVPSGSVRITGLISLVVGDYDGDGKNDFAVTKTSPNAVDTWLGRGDGTFEAGKSFPLGDKPSLLADADVNADGKVDLVVGVGSGRTSKVSVLLGNSEALFANPVNSLYGRDGDFLSIEDLNGDGKLDIALADHTYSVSILPGIGDGFFEGPTSFAVGLLPVSIAIADFNDDDLPDLAVADSSRSGKVVVMLNTSVTLLPGDFDRNGVVNAIDLRVLTDSFGLRGEDLDDVGDRDGDVDGNDFLTWQRNLGRDVAANPAGDYDRSGSVGSNDLSIWKTGYGQVNTDHGADGDRDGDVDGADFLVWQRNLGATVTAALQTANKVRSAASAAFDVATWSHTVAAAPDLVSPIMRMPSNDSQSSDGHTKKTLREQHVNWADVWSVFETGELNTAKHPTRWEPLRMEEADARNVRFNAYEKSFDSFARAADELFALDSPSPRSHLSE